MFCLNFPFAIPYQACFSDIHTECGKQDVCNMEIEK